ncbi:MAG: type II toxin-antitoxin system VapC family toxin [Chthoniobacterales bacterium]
MIYFDSTYIVKCDLAEPGTAEVLALAHSHPGRACASHGRLEFYSAVKRHLREQNLAAAEAHEVLHQFVRDDVQDLWSFLPVNHSLIEMACMRLAALPEIVLCRAADALHLTCAAAIGFSAIYRNDRNLLAAAPYFGLEALNVIG